MSFRRSALAKLALIAGALALSSCGGGSPFSSPPSCPAASTVEAMIAQINAVRAVGRTCGAIAYPAASPLTWSAALAAAAAAHSADMASSNYFDHVGKDGSTPTSRAVAAGYGGVAGENISAGVTSKEAAVEAWVQSPGHCANIMDPNVQDYALACASSRSSEYGTYWTQLFGARR